MSSSPFTGRDLRQFEGEPSTIAATADQYEKLGAAMSRTAATLRDIGSGQISKGTEELKEDAAQLESELRQAGMRYEGTGTALAPYATALETAQSWYLSNHSALESAEADYRSALADQQEARSTPTSPTTDFDQQAEDLADAARAVDATSDIREDLWRAFDSAFADWEDAFNRAADGVADAIEAAGNDDDFWGTVSDVVSIIGSAVIVIAIAALFVASSPWSAILIIGGIALSAAHLAGNIYLHANGKASLSDVMWSVFGLATAGVGGLASRSIALATKANGGAALLTASQSASRFPGFTSGVRAQSMPQLGGFVNPFSRLARGQEWASLSQWGDDLSLWTAKSDSRTATYASEWADIVVDSLPRIGGAGVAAVTSWSAGLAGGVYNSLVNVFDEPSVRP